MSLQRKTLYTPNHSGKVNISLPYLSLTLYIYSDSSPMFEGLCKKEINGKFYDFRLNVRTQLIIILLIVHNTLLQNLVS